MGGWSDGKNAEPAGPHVPHDQGGRHECALTLLSPSADDELVARARQRVDDRIRRRATARDRMQRTLTGSTDDQTERISALWDRTHEEARREAERLRILAASAARIEDPSIDEAHRQAELLQIAAALRCTRGQAEAAVHRAHHAVDMLPVCMDRMSEGELPAAWFERVVKATRPLDDDAAREADASIGASDLEITPEAFARRLRHVVAQVQARTVRPPHATAEGRRRVVLDEPRPDGSACLRVIGPIPEILQLARRLDAAAHATQDAQRQALRDGSAIPVDPRGEIAAHGDLPSLAQLRFDLLCQAGLEADGVSVPPQRFRLNVTVPAMTLLGESNAPGTVDGRFPIPADMAREIASGEETWFRVLTDPARGSFLPLPADRYRPTPAMLEHLRLRHPVCNVPGCGRPTQSPVECDHIEEFAHDAPDSGGATKVENLQLLCRQHHRLKTAGLLDPARVDDEAHTLWSLHDVVIALQDDATDLATEQVVADMEEAWAAYLAADQARREAADRLAALRAGAIAVGDSVTGPDGAPGWTVNPDGTLCPPGPPPPF